jgi:hypothetical protein
MPVLLISILVLYLKASHLFTRQTTMKISSRAFVFLLLCPAVGQAFSQNSESGTRRAFLTNTGGIAAALAAPSIAQAGLLEEFGADPSKIVQQEPPKPVRALPKSESLIEPNLRSNYYYPTNKKRYLPRIKKCSDQVPIAADMIGQEDWEGVAEFANKVADDTILPLKLYTSSLTGAGTNVKVSYTKDMFECADKFEMNQKKLVKAIAKKDRALSSQSLEAMSEALTRYRTVARLGDDMGDLPSIDDIRRATRRLK